MLRGEYSYFMEKNTAGLTGAFAHVYLNSFSFLPKIFPKPGGHVPGERDVLNRVADHSG